MADSHSSTISSARQTIPPQTNTKPTLNPSRRTLDARVNVPERISRYRPPTGRFRLMACPGCGAQTMMREGAFRCSLCPPGEPRVAEDAPSYPLSHFVDCSALRGLRLEAGLSQEALGLQAQVRQKTISDIEIRGTGRLDVARRFAEVLGVDVEDLARESGEARGDAA